MRNRIVIILSLLCLLSACRYDEGGGTGAVKDRIRGEWKLNTVQKNGVTVLTESPSLAETQNNYFSFFISQRLQIDYVENGTLYQADGYYEFSSDKKKIIAKFADRYRTYERRYEILKFKNKELKVQFTDEENTKWILEFTLILSFKPYGY